MRGYKMKVKSLLKACGCMIVNIIEDNGESHQTIAILDYNVNLMKNRDVDEDKKNKIYGTMIHIPEEIQNRNVDFFTSSVVLTAENKYIEGGIRIYLKPIKK
jgi:hypothetical protein